MASQGAPTPKKGSTEHVDVSYRSPEDSLATMRFQPGYGLSLVAAEPMIQEPCLCVWDGNGRMYVAEMRSYMQDADGTGKFDKVSRVVQLVDTDWDGVMDQRTVYADKLMLPRVVLPIGNKVIIGETNTLDLYAYEDTDGDGVADTKELWHRGGKRGGNLEHQPSGLIWAIDNWIYRTYGTYRIRLQPDGKVIREDCDGGGQWGLTADDDGKIVFCNAGGERGPEHFNAHTLYGKLGGVQAPGYREVWPRDNIPDVQGGLRRLRDDNTLNHFTATCGQSVYRARRLPPDFWGNLVFCEPVGRLIRRSVFEERLGETHVANAYDRDEFITATDANFRPINSATGPDGGLYLVDMYRGIIQEGNWVRPGSYLRRVVDETGLAKNVMRGRIWRVTHEDYPRNPQRPQMIGRPALELVQYLSHDNGWWRDTAQVQIIVSGDRNAGLVAALKALARNGEAELGRLHALWTLEGLGVIDANLLRAKFKDRSVRVQCGALRIAEELLRRGDEQMFQDVLALAASGNAQLLKQLVLTISRASIGNPVPHLERVQLQHPEVLGVVKLSTRLIEQHKAKLAALERKRQLAAKERLNLASFDRGKQLYDALCHTCHGKDGRALVVGGQTMATDFRNSVRLRHAHPDALIKSVLHGLTGELAGCTHVGVMVPMKSYGDEQIAGVLNYVRNSFGNKASYLSATDVQRVRAATAKRDRPYTEKELLREHPSYAKIARAVPGANLAPKRSRRLLVVSDSGGHRGPTGRGILALEAMSAKTRAFDVVFSGRTDDLRAENLAAYDAVFLNNTGGIEKVLNKAELRAGLIAFVQNGGGLAAIHAAADGGWDAYTAMLGARGMGHPWRGNRAHGVRVEDPSHPAVSVFDATGFRVRDELYRFNHYDREQVRVLLSVDLKVSNHDRSREDRDNPLAWVREFGRGRVFYSAFGHRPEVFENPAVLQHWLAGIRFALGDLDVPTGSLPPPNRR